MIICPHPALDLTVQAASHLHGIFICHSSSSIVYITAAQNEFYQIPHGYPDQFHFISCAYAPFLIFCLFAAFA